MKSHLPPPTLRSRMLPALGLGVGPAVMAVWVLAMSPASAASPPSPQETGKTFVQIIPEPASAILGLFGFYLILLRRSRS